MSLSTIVHTGGWILSSGWGCVAGSASLTCMLTPVRLIRRGYSINLTGKSIETIQV